MTELIYFALVAALSLVGVTWYGTRAAYRNGLHDGWRACRDRGDPLWNDVRDYIRSVDWSERDMKKDGAR